MKKILALIVPALVLAFGAVHSTDAQAAARVIIVTTPDKAPPGRAFIPGHWEIRLGRQVWVEGRFDRALRAPPRYVPGHWTLRAGRRVWVQPTWR